MTSTTTEHQKGGIKAWIKEAIKRPEVRTAIQASTGYLLLLTILSAPSIWLGLSLPSALIGPIYALVSFSVVLQANVGTALNWVIQRLLAASLAGVLGLCCIYITYAANGVSYESSVTKAAVMTTVSSILGFSIILCGYRWPRIWFGFIVASLTLPIVALSGYHLTYVEPLTMPYFLMNVALGVTMAALVSMFVLPITAGRLIRATTSKSLLLLGQGTKELMDILLGKEEEEEDKSTQQEKSQEQKQSSINLTGFMESWTNPVSAALVKAKALLVPVATEIDVYHRPVLFPRYSYGCLLDLLRHYMSTLMTLVYLAKGEAPLRAAKTLRPDILPVVEKIETCFATAAAVLENSGGGSTSRVLDGNNDTDATVLYISGLDALTELENALHILSTKHVGGIENKNNTQEKSSFSTNATNTSNNNFSTSTCAYTEGEIVMADTVIAIIFALGSRLRRIYFILPETLAHRDSLVWDAWRKHYKGQTWDFEDDEVGGEMSCRLASLSDGGAGQNQVVENFINNVDGGGGGGGGGKNESISPLSSLKSPFASLALQRQVSEVRSPLTPVHLAMLESSLSLPRSPFSKRGGAVGGKNYNLNLGKINFPPPIPAFSLQQPLSLEETPVVIAANRGSDGEKGDDEEVGGGGGGDAAAAADKRGEMQGVQAQKQSHFSSLKQRWNAFPSIVDIDLPFGFTGEGLVLSLQVGIALAAATVVHVCSESYEALNKNTIWVVVTVAVLAQKSVGGVVLKGFNRVIGTIAAGILGLGVIYFVYLTNGLTYTNHLPKFIFMTLSLSFLSGMLMYGSMKAPIQYGYAWMVCKFTLPIISLVGYSGEILLPKTALWRLLNVFVGLAIDLIVNWIVFPQSTKGAVERRICKVLDDLAGISAATSTKVLHTRSDALSLEMSRTSSLFKWISPPSVQQQGEHFLSISSPPEKKKEKGKARQEDEEVAPPPQSGGVGVYSSTDDGAVAGVDSEGTVVVVAPGAPSPPSLTGTNLDAPAVIPPTTKNLHIRTTPTSASHPITSPKALPHVYTGAPSPFISQSSPSYYVSSPTKHQSKKKFRRDRTRWLKHVALGKPVLKLRPLGQDAASLLAAISELEIVAAFEQKMDSKSPIFSFLNKLLNGHFTFSSSSSTHMIDATEIATVRRALRRMLNALLSFVYVLDGPDVPHLKLLLQHRPHIDAVMMQISECLVALRGIASHKLSLDRLIATQTNLRAEMQALIVEIETVPPPRGCTQADVVLGLAGMGVLTAAVQTLGELSDAIINLFAYEIATMEGNSFVEVQKSGKEESGNGDGGGGDDRGERNEIEEGGDTFASSHSISAASLAKNRSSATLRYSGANMPWSSSAKILLGGGGGGSALRLGGDDEEDVEIGLGGGFGRGD